MTTGLTALLAENATPAPLVMGLVAFGTLLLALIIVTRFNKDR